MLNNISLLFVIVLFYDSLNCIVFKGFLEFIDVLLRFLEFPYCLIWFRNFLNVIIRFFKLFNLIILFKTNIELHIQFKNMIELIFISNTQKLMHGSDSMDIPYLSTILTKVQLKKFVDNLTDTLFICDIIRIIKKKFPSPLQIVFKSLIADIC